MAHKILILNQQVRGAQRFFINLNKYFQKAININHKKGKDIANKAFTSNIKMPCMIKTQFTKLH